LGFLGEVLFDRRSVGVSRLLFSLLLLLLFFLFLVVVVVGVMTAGSLDRLLLSTDKTGLLLLSLFLRSVVVGCVVVPLDDKVDDDDVLTAGGSAPI
jgi:hypothetical protein